MEAIIKFFRVNFIGKPYELNKLVFDYSCILQNEQEITLVIKGYRKFYGTQILGMVSSFFLFVISSSFIRHKNITTKSKMMIFLGCITPAICCYIYSYFTYWHIIRPVVIETRERNKRYNMLNKENAEEFKLVFNKSKDYHKKIQQNIGFMKSLFGMFH
jgi:hypothetical protein